jgi:dienelactone hydrolase
VIVDLPLPDSIVAPPLDVHFTHNLPSETARWDLWLDGATEPLAGEWLIVDASGAFSVGDWDSTVDWPETGLGPATAVFRSVSGTSTQAVTTVRLVLADTDRPSEMPSPPTVIGPIGDQRRDILYQSGVRLSLYEPSDVCSGDGRPTIVTGGPQSNVFVEWFQQRGYLVADVAWRSPGYTGGLSTGTLKAFVYAANDLSVGVQWLRAHAEELCVDTERIAAIGYSFGAITSLSLAYTIGELVRGDDLAIDELDGSGTLGAQPPPPPAELASYSNEIAAVVSFAGFAVADTIEPGEPPALLIHGRDDNTIPFALAEQTCAAATQVGITCELIAHDSGHGMADDVAGALTLADEFLRREMGIATPVNP